MSQSLESATTARLPFTSDDSLRRRCLATDDTASLVDAVRMDLARIDLSLGSAVHPYAEGVIRFYRARTILNRGSRPQRYGRAWFYLARLRPHHLPPTARRAFFELVYFMQEQMHRGSFEAIEFSERVLDIAAEIDRFMDEFDRC